ncbi:MAG: hypothetical protein ACXWLG_10550 [Myxococcaceae bacterium]
MGRALHLLLAVLTISAACASAPPPPAPKAVSATDLANGFFHAMKANDVTTAGARFSEPLSQALPPDRLREVFDTLRAQVGELRFWQLTSEDRQPESTRQLYRLEFDRGSMVGLVTVAPQTEQILAVQFLPPGATGPAR